MRTGLAVLALLKAGLVLPPAQAADDAVHGRQTAAGTVVNTRAPGVAGETTYGRVLRAGPGAWEPAEVTTTYRWLRDGVAVRGAVERSYRLGTADLGHRMTVRVTATDANGDQGQADSEPSAPVDRATLVSRERPAVSGAARYGRTLRATPGRWSERPDRVEYRWLRDGEPIGRARGSWYAVQPGDVGHRLAVEVTARAEGHEPAVSRSRPTRAQHRVGVRRRVTYAVTTRGRVTADLAQFRRQVQQTYDDARGWRGRGVQFTPVRRGGSFTVVLAEASTVPSFSSVCSAEWSCRVGRYVIINQTRWQHASPAWNAARGALRDYRHMVVNHETGHWLGYGHAGCGGRGQLAPVMMQQSKGLDGCRFNPWPTLAELRR